LWESFTSDWKQFVNLFCGYLYPCIKNPGIQQTGDWGGGEKRITDVF
jgi:hypothetical protein